jgi:hypothetical protein
MGRRIDGTPRPPDSAAVGVDALLGKRATNTVFRVPAMAMQDEDFIAEWTAMLAGRGLRSAERQSQCCVLKSPSSRVCAIWVIAAWARTLLPALSSGGE